MRTDFRLFGRSSTINRQEERCNLSRSTILGNRIGFLQNALQSILQRSSAFPATSRVNAFDAPKMVSAGEVRFQLSPAFLKDGVSFSGTIGELTDMMTQHTLEALAETASFKGHKISGSIVPFREGEAIPPKRYGEPANLVRFYEITITIKV